MKQVNKIFLILFIICGLFIVGDNEYFYQSIIVGLILAVAYFFIYAGFLLKRY